MVRKGLYFRVYGVARTCVVIMKCLRDWSVRERSSSTCCDIPQVEVTLQVLCTTTERVKGGASHITTTNISVNFMRADTAAMEKDTVHC
jgi:hypothetical protein